MTKTEQTSIIQPLDSGSTDVQTISASDTITDLIKRIQSNREIVKLATDRAAIACDELKALVGVPDIGGKIIIIRGSKKIASISRGTIARIDSELLRAEYPEIAVAVTTIGEQTKVLLH